MAVLMHVRRWMLVAPLTVAVLVRHPAAGRAVRVPHHGPVGEDVLVLMVMLMGMRLGASATADTTHVTQPPVRSP